MVKNISGKRFGRLIALDEFYLKNHKAFWLCECDCGNKVYVSGNALQGGRTKSCGCLYKETRQGGLKHGKWSHPIYWVYRSMLERCYNKNNPFFHNYGGRGIIVCDEWKKDFKCFYDWATSNGWTIGLQIDRTNNDGNYSPLNCRFVTRKVNMNNRQSSIKLIIDQKEYSLDQLEKLYGVPAQRISHRIKHNGWPVEEAVKQPVGKRGYKPF